MTNQERREIKNKKPNQYFGKKGCLRKQLFCHLFSHCKDRISWKYLLTLVNFSLNFLTFSRHFQFSIPTFFFVVNLHKYIFLHNHFSVFPHWVFTFHSLLKSELKLKEKVSLPAKKKQSPLRVMFRLTEHRLYLRKTKYLSIVAHTRMQTYKSAYVPGCIHLYGRSPVCKRVCCWRWLSCANF